MAGLCIADIDRWSVGQINYVFGICADVADHCEDTSRTLGTLDAFATWTGQASDAAKDSVDKTRKDLDRHSEVARKVGDAARKANREVEDIVHRLMLLRTEAGVSGLDIDPHTDTVYAANPPTMQGWPAADKLAYQDEIDDLQLRVNMLIVDADKADHDLANAIKLADGEKENFSLKPTPGELVLGGVAGGTAAKVDLINELWAEAIKQDPTTAGMKILPWLEKLSDKPLLRGMSGTGGLVGAVTAVPSVISDVGDGDSVTKAVTREGTGLVAGMALGAEAGAAAGTVFPGAGNIVGIVVGAGVGALASWGASKGVDWLWGDG